MLTLQELKGMVDGHAPGTGVPTAKELAGSGRMVAQRRLGPDTEITAYKSGYAVYRVGNDATVFPIHRCGGYRYDTGTGPCSIGGEFFEEEAWYLRLAMEGEDRLCRNREAKERRKTVSYSAVSEEWAALSSAGDGILDRIVLEETLGEALSSLTGRQKAAVRRFFLEQRTQGQIAEELGVTPAAVSGLVARALGRMRGQNAVSAAGCGQGG